MSLMPEMWQAWNCLWPERLHVFTCLRAFKITETSGDVLSINITLSQDLAGCALLTYFKQRWLQSLRVLPLFPNNYLLSCVISFPVFVLYMVSYLLLLTAASYIHVHTQRTFSSINSRIFPFKRTTKAQNVKIPQCLKISLEDPELLSWQDCTRDVFKGKVNFFSHVHNQRSGSC